MRISSDDLGHTLEVVVTASNAYGSYSAAPGLIGDVGAPNPLSLDAAINGTARVGQTLNVTTGSWGGVQPITFEYIWSRCDDNGANCAAIGGATDQTYTVTAADQGHVLEVKIVGSNQYGANGWHEVGATDVVAAALFVSAVSPATGSTVGGTAVTVSGGWFTGATSVLFGSVPAQSFTVVDDTTIVAITPAGSAGPPVNVRVVSPGGTSAVGSGDAFTYVASTPAGGPESHPQPPAPVARPLTPAPPSSPGVRKPPPGQP